MAADLFFGQVIRDCLLARANAGKAMFVFLCVLCVFVVNYELFPRYTS